MSALKLTQIGNSVGVILPKEVRARLKVEKGDVLYLTEAANGVTFSIHVADEHVEPGATIYLEVRESNAPAQALYRSRGFETAGRRAAYYQHPEEDALVFRREWAGPPGDD